MRNAPTWVQGTPSAAPGLSAGSGTALAFVIRAALECRAGRGLCRRTACLPGVDRDVETGDESVAQVAGGALAQGSLPDQSARRGGDVVPLGVRLLQNLGGDRPVALVDQPRVELGRKRSPAFGRCPLGG